MWEGTAVGVADGVPRARAVVEGRRNCYTPAYERRVWRRLRGAGWAEPLALRLLAGDAVEASLVWEAKVAD